MSYTATTLAPAPDATANINRVIFLLIFWGVTSIELNLPRENTVWGNYVSLAATAAVLAYAIPSGRLFRFRISFEMFALAAYTVFCGLSALWSPSPVDTIAQVFLLTMVYLSIAALKPISTTSVVSSMLTSGLFVALLSFAMIVVLPQYAFQQIDSGRPELKGIFGHQQRLGLFMCMVIGLMVIAWLNGELNQVKSKWTKRYFPLVALLIVACALAAFARFYLLFLTLSLSIVFALGQRGQRRFWMMLLISFVSLFFYVYADTLGIFIENSNVDLTFSGRTRVWERSMMVADMAPIKGHGFASFINPVFDDYFPNYRAPHAHNSFLQAYFETGLIGLCLLIVLIFAQLRVAVKASKFLRPYPYSLFMTVFCLLCGLTGVFYAGKLSQMFCLTVLIVAVEGAELRSARSHKLHTTAAD